MEVDRFLWPTRLDETTTIVGFVEAPTSFFSDVVAMYWGLQ
jgi:hypothetical protein